MWLTKQYRKLIYSISVSAKDDYEDFIVHALDPKLYRNYDFNKAHLIHFTTVYPTIEQYTKNIKYVTDIIKASEALNNHWCKYDYQNKVISSFMTDSKGKSINEEKAIYQYRQNLLEYYQEFKRITKSEDFSDQHKVRILSKFNKHLRDVNNALVEFSIL